MHCDLLVIGLGYVGLPLAREATAAGMTVVGYDVNQAIVDRLNRGGSHVDDIPADDVAAMLTAGFRATSDESAVGTPETVVICVPTPLSAASGPDLTAVQAAAGLVGRLLRPGMLIVLESTTYPGTTDEVLRPVLEATSGRSPVLRQALRPGGPGCLGPGGRDGQAAGEHLPPREHRAGQRDGDLLPRTRRGPVGRDQVRSHQAVRLPAVLP